MLSADVPVQGELFNVAIGERVSLNQLILILKKLTGSAVQPFHRPDRPGDVKDSLADISKARKLLLYNPQVKIEEGLVSTLAWFRQKTQ